MSISGKTMELPPGQRWSSEFYRFGLTKFARRFPKQTGHVEIAIEGDVGERAVIPVPIRDVSRVDIESDFHCVTTWSYSGLRWSGYRFRDVFETAILPRAVPADDANFVVLRGQDGARSSLPLEDLLEDNVILADRLNGEPLTVEHGAPVRLVAPAHYGYKSVKHLCRIEFWRDDAKFRPSAFRFMDHPRGRVAQEERGRGMPGRFYRWLYRPLVHPTARRFRAAMIAREGLGE